MQQTSDNPGSSRILIASIALVALLAGIATARWITAKNPQPPQLVQATWLSEPRGLSAIDLIDHQGTSFTLDSLKHHWSFLFFGYTHCPDVCPTTMTTLQQMAKLLRKNNFPMEKLQVIFVSVDPERDNPERMAEFVRYFDSSFIGVTGEKKSIEQLTKQLGIAYSLSAATSEGDYAVNHSASILLIDPQARLSAIISPPHGATEIAQDLTELANYYDNNL